MLDERAAEVQLSLQISRDAPLPVVAVRPEAAITLSRSPKDVNLDLVPHMGFSTDADVLDMVFEPQPIEEILEEGRRHTLHDEAITLVPATPSPPGSVERSFPHIGFGMRADTMDQAFGAPSPADQIALAKKRLSSAARLHAMTPLRGMSDGSVPPEVDHLLGASTHGGGHEGLLSTGGVVRRPGGLSAVDPAAHSALVPSSLAHSGDAEMKPLDALDGMASPPLRQLDFNIDMPGSAGSRGGHIFDLVGFSPATSSDHAGEAGMPLAPLVNEPLEPADIVEALGVDDEPEAAEDAVVEAGAPAEGPPPKKKRRKIKPWFDEITTISKDVYRDASAFTLDLSNGHHIHLPYRRPGLPFTTVSSDMCELLCEPFFKALEVGERRRNARIEREQAAAAAAAAAVTDHAEVAGNALTEAAASPAPRDPTAADGSPPLASGSPEAPAPHSDLLVAPLPPPDSPPPAAVVGPGASSPLPRPPSAHGGADIPVAEAHHSPPPLGGLSSPTPEAHRPLEHGDAVSAYDDPYALASPGAGGDVVMGTSLSAVTGRSPAMSVAEMLGARSVPRDSPEVSPMGAAPSPAMASHSSTMPTPGTAGWSAETPVPNTTVPEAGSPWPASPDGRAEVSSFFSVVKAPPGDAESAARRFMNLLFMHAEGQVVLEQEQAYGDIAINIGPSWPGSVEVTSAA